MMKIISQAALFLMLAAASAQAQQTQQKMTINLQMTPEMQEQADAYEKAVKALSPEQVRMLDDVIKKGAAETTRVKLADLSMNSETIKICTKKMQGAQKEALLRAYAEYESYVQAQIAAGRYRVQQGLEKINFMSPKMMADALHREDMVTLGMAQAMQKLALQNGMSTDEMCGALPNILEKEFAPLPGAENMRPHTQKIMFNTMDTGTKQCRLGGRVALEDGRTISLTSLYSADSTRTRGDMSFSYKFYDPKGNQIPMKTGWISYGGVDSRAINYSMTENSALVLGVVPDEAIVAALARLRKHPMTIAVQAMDGHVTGFKLTVPPEEVDKMAACASAVDRSKIAALQQTGFTASPAAPSTQAAAPQGKVYQLMNTSAEGMSLPLCVTNNTQKAADGNEYSLMLVFTTMESTPEKKAPIASGLWVAGVEANKGPISLQNARVTMAAQGERPAFDSAQAGTVAATGTFYKIALERKEFGQFFDGLRQIPAQVKVGNIEVSFPAMPPEDAVLFGTCVKELMARP